MATIWPVCRLRLGVPRAALTTPESQLSVETTHQVVQSQSSKRPHAPYYELTMAIIGPSSKDKSVHPQVVGFRGIFKPNTESMRPTGSPRNTKL